MRTSPGRSVAARLLELTPGYACGAAPVSRKRYTCDPHARLPPVLPRASGTRVECHLAPAPLVARVGGPGALGRANRRFVDQASLPLLARLPLSGSAPHSLRRADAAPRIPPPPPTPPPASAGRRSSSGLRRPHCDPRAAVGTSRSDDVCSLLLYAWLPRRAEVTPDSLCRLSPRRKAAHCTSWRDKAQLRTAAAGPAGHVLPRLG
jgi:hypothetical protein